MHHHTILRRALALTLAAPLALAAGCGSPGGGSSSSDVIDYWLWDSAQQPGYQQCADAFEQQHPGTTVRITQYGWGDYWSKLTAGFIADRAPDVFTNHLSQYSQFVDLDVLLSLDEFEATKDVDDDAYAEGLAALWKGQDGHRYGIPKDWDTVAIFYDASVTRAAGIDDEQLANLDWNPDDGGSFERVIAHLTVDEHGVRGDEPGFDKDHVAVYGLASEGGGGSAHGQTQWAPFTSSLGGWEPVDRNPWATRFNYDDPRFQQTIEWYFGLAEKGYMPRFDTFGAQTGAYQQLAAGRAALSLNGSWMISSYLSIPDIELSLAPTPVGPSGSRASIFNGLADSVTRFADNPELAAEWVAYMGSAECQTVIADAGVVFPARKDATERSLQVRKDAGLDVTPFTVHLDEGTTKLLPVTRHAADITALMEPALEAVYTGRDPAASLTDLNDQLNTLLDLTQS
ncbi:sugar ABC transporter substrate-binding protein [uncultured Tessaracoccus sp.]|uniref:ABC transporter substrate-binding protein n=1 Tax=uncultured Tessaracoccus sp. TaxID=905023 RepID=UPI0025F69747|nr:sugar ABC transporter substrate-binding protein [uncultured Tessaracoccus sp.]